MILLFHASDFLQQAQSLFPQLYKHFAMRMRNPTIELMCRGIMIDHEEDVVAAATANTGSGIPHWVVVVQSFNFREE